MNSIASLKISWRLKIGLTVILLLCVAKFGLIPLYDWQDRTIQKIQVFQKAIDRKKDLIGNQKDIDQLLLNAERSFREVVQFYDKDFSDAQSLQLKLQKELERLSLSNNVKIISTDWLVPVEGEIITQAPIRIRCEAPPDRLLAFVYAIEMGKQFRSLDKLTIISQSRKKTVSATMDISSYGIL